MRSAHVFALLACAPVAAATAQDSLDVRPGVRVRITVPEIELNKAEGTVLGTAGDVMVLEIRRTRRGRSVGVDTLRIASGSVERLYVHRGMKSNAAQGFLYGGLGLGLLSGAALGSACNDASSGFLAQDCSFGQGFGTGFVAGFFVGGILGAVFGAVAKSDRWEEVPLDQLRVSVVPQRDGRFAFRLSVAF